MRAGIQASVRCHPASDGRRPYSTRHHRKVNPNASLNTIGDITHALTPFMGVAMGRLLFSLGVLGAAMISSVVVSLAAAWGLVR